jgi:hypothetical protein
MCAEFDTTATDAHAKKKRSPKKLEIGLKSFGKKRKERGPYGGYQQSGLVLAWRFGGNLLAWRVGELCAETVGRGVDFPQLARRADGRRRRTTEKMIRPVAQRKK